MLKFALKALVLVMVALNLNAKDVVIDTIKGQVKVPENPQKVVVIDYGALDTMDALGVSVKLALPKGVKPTHLKKYEKGAVEVGSLFEPNFEKIYEFKPDLIILGGRGVKAYDELSKIAPTLYYLPDYNNFGKDTFKMAEDFGVIFGKQKEAKEQINGVKKLVDNAKEIAKNTDKKLLFVLTNDGKISAYGRGSRFGFVFSDFGFSSIDESIKSSRHGQSINYEFISEKNPDVLLYVDRTSVVGGGKLGNETLNNALVNESKAGKNGKIIPLSADIWYLAQGGLNAYKTCVNEVLNAFK